MTDRQQEIDFDDFINIDLNRAMRKLQREFLGEVLSVEKLGLQEWRVLLNLYRFGDSHIRRLARLASLDPSPLAKAVGALETRGLVRRSDDAEDARRKQVSLTDQGAKTVDRVWPKARALSDRVKAQIGKTRFNALQDALKKIQEIPDTGVANIAAE